MHGDQSRPLSMIPQMSGNLLSLMASRQAAMTLLLLSPYLTLAISLMKPLTFLSVSVRRRVFWFFFSISVTRFLFCSIICPQVLRNPFIEDTTRALSALTSRNLMLLMESASVLDIEFLVCVSCSTVDSSCFIFYFYSGKYSSELMFFTPTQLIRSWNSYPMVLRQSQWIYTQLWLLLNTIYRVFWSYQLWNFHRISGIPTTRCSSASVMLIRKHYLSHSKYRLLLYTSLNRSLPLISPLAVGSNPHFQNLVRNIFIRLTSNLLVDRGVCTRASHTTSPATCTLDCSLQVSLLALSTRMGMRDYSKVSPLMYPLLVVRVSTRPYLYQRLAMRRNQADTSY